MPATWRVPCAMPVLTCTARPRVGDNAKRIALAIQQSLERCDIVITTGGLGPTVDDPTREAVALAMGVETEYRPELWEQIQSRFKRFGRQPTENNRRQAYVPQGSHRRRKSGWHCADFHRRVWQPGGHFTARCAA